jgi:acyl-CoA synthetase (AMP-forming)/AMP-acid ligase II
MMVFDPVLVHEWLTLAASQTPEKCAVVCGSTRWSYASLDRASTMIARSLSGGGVAPQDRVVVFADTSAEVVAAIYGIMRAGCVFVVINSTTKAPKLRFVIEDCAARIVIADRARGAMVAEVLESIDRPCQSMDLDDVSSAVADSLKSPSIRECFPVVLGRIWPPSSIRRGRRGSPRVS